MAGLNFNPQQFLELLKKEDELLGQPQEAIVPSIDIPVPAQLPDQIPIRDVGQPQTPNTNNAIDPVEQFLKLTQATKAVQEQDAFAQQQGQQQSAIDQQMQQLIQTQQQSLKEEVLKDANSNTIIDNTDFIDQLFGAGGDLLGGIGQAGGDLLGGIGDFADKNLRLYQNNDNGLQTSPFYDLLRIAAATESPKVSKFFESEVASERAKVKANKELSTKIKEAGAKSAESKNKAVTDLRKEYNALPVIKSTNEIESSVSRMTSVWNNFANLPPEQRDEKSKIALDQALVIVFNKMLDPGSVVRESEFARTPENAAAVNKFFGKLKQFTEGGVGLVDADRVELVKTAQLLAEGQREQSKQTTDFFIKEATQQGLDPERIIIKSGANRTQIAELPKDKPKEIVIGQKDGFAIIQKADGSIVKRRI